MRNEIACEDIDAATEILCSGVIKFKDSKSVRALTLIAENGYIIINKYRVSEVHETKLPNYKEIRLQLYRNMDGKEKCEEIEL